MWRGKGEGGGGGYGHMVRVKESCRSMEDDAARSRSASK
jgi:hypothetical protein